jgi:RNA polymerase sigma-70 factor (ECF subfamily)
MIMSKLKKGIEIDVLLPFLIPAAQGKLDALEKLLEMTSAYITKRSYSLSGNYDEAQDIAQDVMLRIYKNISGLKDPNSYFGWQEQIIRNTVYDHFRKNKKSSMHVSIDDEMNNEAISENPIQHVNLEKNEQSLILKKIISALPLREQTAFFLREYEECSSEEIGRLMNIKPSSARGLYIKAGKKVARLLRAEMGSMK